MIWSLERLNSLEIVCQPILNISTVCVYWRCWTNRIIWRLQIFYLMMFKFQNMRKIAMFALMKSVKTQWAISLKLRRTGVRLMWCIECVFWNILKMRFRGNTETRRQIRLNADALVAIALISRIVTSSRHCINNYLLIYKTKNYSFFVFCNMGFFYVELQY